MSLIPANEEQQIAIFEEINETTNTKLEENIRIIKQWIENQPHLPHNYDERILPTVIRGCKHQLERVKSKLDCYYTSKTLMPELFQQRDVTLPELQIIKQQFEITVLPRLTPSGCRITYQCLTKDFNKVDLKNVIKIMLMIGDIRLIEEGPISGDIFIYDLGSVTSSGIAKIINPYMKKGLSFTQNALPQRLKEIHLVNCPSYAETAINFVKMFMKPKIRNRFQVHSSMESLFQKIPIEYFPSDFGGNEKSLISLQDDWWKKLENYCSYFEKQESVHSDESKRTQQNNHGADICSDVYGTVGSFHKLNID